MSHLETWRDKSPDEVHTLAEMSSRLGWKDAHNRKLKGLVARRLVPYLELGGKSLGFIPSDVARALRSQICANGHLLAESPKTPERPTL